jgi:hypothetical protein
LLALWRRYKLGSFYQRHWEPTRPSCQEREPPSYRPPFKRRSRQEANGHTCPCPPPCSGRCPYSSCCIDA